MPPDNTTENLADGDIKIYMTSKIYPSRSQVTFVVSAHQHPTNTGVVSDQTWIVPEVSSCRQVSKKGRIRTSMILICQKITMFSLDCLAGTYGQHIPKFTMGFQNKNHHHLVKIWKNASPLTWSNQLAEMLDPGRNKYLNNQNIRSLDHYRKCYINKNLLIKWINEWMTWDGDCGKEGEDDGEDEAKGQDKERGWNEDEMEMCNDEMRMGWDEEEMRMRWGGDEEEMNQWINEWTKNKWNGKTRIFSIYPIWVKEERLKVGVSLIQMSGHSMAVILPDPK